MRRILMFLCLLVASLNLYAQNKTITGKVTDENQVSVSGATVSAKGAKSVITNATGGFSIIVPASTTSLVFSAVNFNTQDIIIGNQSIIKVTLITGTKDLSDVVVMGYGSAKKKENLVGSVANIDGKQIANRPNPNLLDALQGQVPGLQVYTSSGEPSATQSVRLNGVGSLGSGSTPLYVLDGIPIDPGTILSVNPNDFESITVLKDASATSIYGTRAANGVIYFTSKKGIVNRPVISLNTQYGVSNLTNNTEDLFNSFMSTDQFVSFLLATQQSQAQINSTLAAGIAKLSNNTKWYKTYYKQDQPMYQADLSLSGGSGKTTYYVSGSYNKTKGVAYRSDYERFTLRANINTNVTDWAKIGINTIGGYDKRETNPYGLNNLNRGLSLLGQPWFSPTDSLGNRYDFIPGLGLYHPEYLQDKITASGNNLQINPTGYIQINPVKDLTLRSQAGLDFYDYRSSTLTYPSFIGANGSGNASEGFTRGATKTITNTGEYIFNVAKEHQFTVLGGQEFIKYESSSISGSANGILDDRLVLLNSTLTTPVNASSKSEKAYFSYFGRLNYSWKSKYFVDGSFRRDKATIFGANKQWASFWSAGAMWKLKEENFMKNIWWVTDLNVRASIGTTGNSSGLGDYQALAKVGSIGSYNGSQGWGVADPGNPDLTWEKQRQINIGFNALLFKKLSIEAEYFDRTTTSMLFPVPYPYTSGYSSVYSNIGGLKNKGINVGLKYNVLRGKNGGVDLFGNFGWVEQKVTELFQGKSYYTLASTGITYAVGQPVTFYYPIFSHIDPATGNPLWFVPNSGDGFISTSKDGNNITSNFSATALMQNTGIKRYAPFNGGFGFNADYKGFSISTLFAFSQGKYLINNDRYFFENPTVFPGYNQSANVLDYWKKPGDVTRFPKAGVQFTQFDSRLIEDASFVRLKTLTVGYTMPRQYLGKVVKGLSMYVTFRNLLTWTKYTGPDPEVDANLTYGAYPNTRQTSAGLNFTF